MSTTFRRIREVSVGDKISSIERNNLSDGVNDRLRSGLGCGTFRMWTEYFSFGRDVIQPVGDAFAENDVWLKAFSNIPYGDADAEYPGDDQSVNPLNPLMAFIVGCNDYDLSDEERLNDIQAQPFSDARTAWESGKQQRGYIDLDTGLENSPSFTAARFYRSIPAGSYPFLVKYGGWMPTPAQGANCSDGSPRSVYPFTALNTSLPNLIFMNACSGDPEDDGLVAFEETDDGYLLTFKQGHSRKLLFTDYVFGPLTGPPQLRFTASDAIENIMFRFAADFRGTITQRADDKKYHVAKDSFDFQKFLTSQYFLAPAQATDLGNGTLNETGYPLFHFPGPPSTVNIRSGYCLAGYRIKTHLSLGGTLTVGDDLIVLSVAIPTGDTETFVWLPTPVDASGNYPIATSDLTQWDDDATLEVELAILEKVKPSLNDAYVVLRRSSTDAGKEFDNRGRDYPSAPKISSGYFTHGCIFADSGIPPQVGGEVNTNPMHDAAVDLFRKHFRFVKRESFRGYAVENGKSVLWFDRKVNVGGKSFDIFDGIAPIVIKAPPNGSTNEWLMFMSTNVYSDSDSSALKDDNYGDVDTFLHNRAHFLSNGLLGFVDDLFPHLAPGQLPIAPPIYTPSATSDNYASGLNSVQLEQDDARRGKFFQSNPIYPPDYEIESAELTVQSYGPNVLAGALFDQSTTVGPEHVANEINAGTLTEFDPGTTGEKFIDFDAGKVYVIKTQFTAPVTGRILAAPGASLNDPVQSIWRTVVPGGEIKLTFKTRFRNTGEVASDVPRDGLSNYDGFAYRTDENALVQYLTNNISPLIGDAAELQDLNQLFGQGAISGSIQPRFYFTQLMPKVWEETPDTDIQDANDTRCFSEDLNYACFILQSICEGFIDPLAAPVVQNCGQRPSQYTFQSLCFQIDGTFSRFPFIKRALNGQKGFGPVPNTVIYAELFNDLAKGFNLLTKVPVELPFTATTQWKDYSKVADFGIDNLSDHPPRADDYHCDLQPPLTPDSFYHGTAYLFGSSLPETPGDDDDPIAVGIPDHNLNVEARLQSGLNSGQYFGDLVLPIVNCANKSFTSVVTERRWVLSVQLDTRPVLDNLTGLFESTAGVKVSTFTRFSFVDSAEASGGGFGLPTCGLSVWPSYAPIYVKSSEVIVNDCDTVPVPNNLSLNYILRAPGFHGGVCWWMTDPSLTGSCSGFPKTTRSINIGVNVLIATVPLV